MNYISIIGLAVSIILIVYLSLKGISVLVAAPLATMVVILTNQMDFFPSLLGSKDSFMTYLAEFIVNFFMVFVLGSIMAKYLDYSGAIHTITGTVIKGIKDNNQLHGLMVVYLVTALLTYGGISLYVVAFAVVPLAKSLFSQLNIPWKLAPLPIVLGLGTFTAGMLPGSPSIINAIPTEYLGTTLTAAPVLGIVATIVSIVVSILYMKYVIKKEIPTLKLQEIKEGQEEIKNQIGNEPSLFRSLLPTCVLILLIIVGSVLEIKYILILSLFIVIIFEAFLFHKYIHSHIEVLNIGVNNAIQPLLNTAATISFGQMISNLKTFTLISNGIMNISSYKLIGISILTFIFSMITGSASGAVGIVTKTQGLQLVALQYHPELIHRIIAIASIVFTNTPHSGVVLTLFALTKLTHKESFKYMYFGTVLSSSIALLSVLVLAVFLY
ncbi:MAG: H+/gluconate symporter [Lachnospiraceae bacterium]|jgi:H+/gluconate symporter-like permease|nr:H+/gluconate symporter [Lachnospiraceae bacterium]